MYLIPSIATLSTIFSLWLWDIQNTGPEIDFATKQQMTLESLNLLIKIPMCL